MGCPDIRPFAPSSSSQSAKPSATPLNKESLNAATSQMDSDLIRAKSREINIIKNAGRIGTGPKGVLDGPTLPAKTLTPVTIAPKEIVKRMAERFGKSTGARFSHRYR